MTTDNAPFAVMYGGSPKKYLKLCRRDYPKRLKHDASFEKAVFFTSWLISLYVVRLFRMNIVLRNFAFSLSVRPFSKLFRAVVDPVQET